MKREFAVLLNNQSNNWYQFFIRNTKPALSIWMLLLLAACGGGSDDKKEQENYINYMNEQSRTRPIYEDANMAFTRTVTGGTDIFFLGNQGEDGLNLTNLGAGKNEQPALSPDNTKIAFVSRRDAARGEIYVMNINGSNVIRLTNNTYWDIHPCWSPDGTKIAFVSDRDGQRNIYTMSSIDGSNITRVTNNARNDDSPSWSPDGKEIVFSSELGSSTQTPVPRLYKIKVDGTGQILISKTVNEHEIEPSWSSKNIIAYTRSDANGAQIYTMNPDGSQVTKLSDGKGGWHPGWSDVGDKIAFVSDRTNAIRVYTMLSDGTKIQQLITKANMEFEPDWGTPPKKP